MKEVTYTVVCSANPEHKFPVTFEIEDNSKGAPDSADVFCPFCGTMVRVKVEGKLVHDAEVHRKFGFKNQR